MPSSSVCPLPHIDVMALHISLKGRLTTLPLLSRTHDIILYFILNQYYGSREVCQGHNIIGTYSFVPCIQRTTTSIIRYIDRYQTPLLNSFFFCNSCYFKFHA